MLSFAEQELSQLLCIEQTRHSLLQTFRKALEFLTRVDGLTSATDLAFALLQTLGLVHLLDSVKDNKISIQKDFVLYEEYLEAELMRQEDHEALETNKMTLEERLERCRRLREVFSTRWWFLNGLLSTLGTLSKAARVLADLAELLTRDLLAEEDGCGPVLFPHEKYKLLRALPIVLHLHNFLNKKATFKEPISFKAMDACFKLLKRYPVVPGVGDCVILLYVPILGIIFTPGGNGGKETKRFSATSLDELDKKYIEYLEREYSVATRHQQVRVQHDRMCDRLTRFLKATEKWRRVGGKRPVERCQAAVNISYEILSCLSEWRCSIHELLAWRKSAPSVMETLGTDEQSSDFVSLPNRVTRLFHDSDVPHVLEMLVCVEGLARFFKVSKEFIMPYVVDWLQHSAKLFLDHTAKKRGLTEPDTKVIFSTIASLKEQVLEARHTQSESSSRFQSIHNTRFDAADPEAASKLRKVTEELHYLYSLHPPKPKISSFICGHPNAASSGIQKATRDLLQQLYKIQAVLKSDVHLEKITDFSDLCLREREIEVTGKVQLNTSAVVALQLARAGITSTQGGSLEPVLTSLGLFESTSEKLLNLYKSKMAFFELRKSAMEGLDIILKEVCKHAVLQAKFHACFDVLLLQPSQWIDEAKGMVPRRSIRCFDAFFKRKTLCLAGCDVEIQSSLIRLIDSAIKEEISDIVSRIEVSKDPAAFVDCRTRIEILKCAHQWLTRHLPLPQFPQLNTKSIIGQRWGRVSLGLSMIFSSCIMERLFQDFMYDMRLRKFKIVPENSMEPFPFKICPRPSTPKISFNEFRKDSVNISSSFGFADINVLCHTLSQSDLDQLVASTRDYIKEQLVFFLNDNLGTIFQLLPLELVDLRISNLAQSEKKTPLECLIWFEPMRNLEKLGNALIFLHMLQVHLNRHYAIQVANREPRFHTRSHPDRVTPISSYQEDSDSDLDVGNPFAKKIKKEKSRSQPKPKQISKIDIIQECIQQVHQVISDWLSESKRSLSINNAFSAILFLKIYALANFHILNVPVGDGVLWASKLILQFVELPSSFEQTDWMHDLLELTQVQEAIAPVQTSGDIRCLLKYTQHVIECWRHLSRYWFLSMNSSKHQDSRSGWYLIKDSNQQRLKMLADPPLRGFFGGMCYVPNSNLRQSHGCFSRRVSPFSSSLSEYKTNSMVRVKY
eukprot:g1721.t1